MPTISIITPAFNAETFLPHYFKSLAQQHFYDYEVLIIDDFSNDSTKRLIKQQISVDPRIRLISLQKNIGAAGARNEGLRQARGEYVCFLDVDDYWLPEKLSIQLEFMRSNGYSLTYMDYLRVDIQRQPINRVTAPKYIEYTDMLKSNRIGNLSAMFRRTSAKELIFRQIGHEDYVFWLELLRRIGKAYRTPTAETMCCYMVRQKSLSSNKLKAAKWQWTIYRNAINLPLITAISYMIQYFFLAIKKRV